MKIVEEPKKQLSMHPKKFAMWLFMATVLMLFASLTSAYIVREAEGNWLFFELPSLFYYTTGIIIISSVTMQMGYFAFRRKDVNRAVSLLAVTSGLGVLFLVGQFMAWGDLVSRSVHFVGNPSGSFLYVLTGLHGLHIISALVFLFILLFRARRGTISPANMAPMEMGTTYWHFLGALWIYLFVFLLINR